MKSTQTEKTATAARNAVQLSKQGPYAWGVVERDGKLIAQGLSKGAAEALAKTATACQKTPDYWAQTDQTHSRGEILRELDCVRNQRNEARDNAGALAEALRRIAFDPIGKSDATHREVLEGIENIAREALARWEAK